MNKPVCFCRLRVTQVTCWSGVYPKTWTWREWSSKPSPAAPTESARTSCEWLSLQANKQSKPDSNIRRRPQISSPPTHLPSWQSAVWRSHLAMPSLLPDSLPHLPTPHLSSFCSYFRKGRYFGLACFANMAVESTEERGARMKSVGILSPSYTLLYRYMSFLEHQVR